MSKQYTGRQKTKEAYKKERKRIMDTIRRLEKQGVTVPETLIPKQGGKVVYEDVQKLKRLTREKILEKSSLTVVTKSVYKGGKGRGVIVPIETTTFTGKDVIYELRKKQNRERIESAKQRAAIRKENNWVVVDNETGEVLKSNLSKEEAENESKKLSEERKKKEDEERLRKWVEEVESEQYYDEEDNLYIEPSDEDYDGYGDWESTLDTIVDSFLDTVDSLAELPSDNRRNKNKRTREIGRNAKEISDYIRRAIGMYGKAGVGKALLDMEDDGIDLGAFENFYSDNYFTFYEILINTLPLDGTYDYNIDTNDRNDEMEDI